MIQVKRAYEKPSRADGMRILVDRLWPRRLTKERAGATIVAKGRGSQPGAAEVVRARSGQMEGVSDPLSQGTPKREGRPGGELKREGKQQTVTLVYAARDEAHNEALVLKRMVEGRKG